MAVYSWDRETINGIARRLEAEMHNLETQKTKLMQNKEQAAGIYQGEAAAEFQATLEADLANMDLVREMVRQQANKLRRIAEIHYKNCEDELSQRVRALAGEIR